MIWRYVNCGFSNGAEIDFFLVNKINMQYSELLDDNELKVIQKKGIKHILDLCPLPGVAPYPALAKRISVLVDSVTPKTPTTAPPQQLTAEPRTPSNKSDQASSISDSVPSKSDAKQSKSTKRLSEELNDFDHSDCMFFVWWSFL